MYIATGQTASQGTKYSLSTKRPYHFPICCKFQRNLFEVWLYTIFSWFNTCYIAPGQGTYIPQGTKFWCQWKLLVTSVICCYFQIVDNNRFLKIHCFTFFPYKSIRHQIWSCRKICQDQPRVIIWTYLVVLEHPMLHTKFQGHRPLSSGEQDFLRFLP